MNEKIKEIIENEMDCLITDVDFVIKKEGNLQALVNMLEVAINYTHSCTELKDKEVLTFNEWLSNFEKTEDNNYWLNKEVLYCKEAMLLHYNDLPDE
mgnify:CR=1 FL=1